MRGDPRLRVVAPAPGSDALASASDPPASGSSPGRYLQEIRTRRGMSLEQLAMMTKIPKRQLVLLEEDRFDEMPGQVFVKGFLRCCARALRVDEEIVIGLLYDLEREQSRGRRGGSSGTMMGSSGSTARRQPGLNGLQGMPGTASRATWRQLVAMLGLFDPEGRIRAARVLTIAIVVLLVALAVIVAFTMAASFVGSGAVVPS